MPQAEAVDNRDLFRCIRSEQKTSDNRGPINDFIEKPYKAYFGMKPGAQDITWASP